MDEEMKLVQDDLLESARQQKEFGYRFVACHAARA
jgi:hypothetical protein